jgi:hypothetical protein
VTPVLPCALRATKKSDAPAPNPSIATMPPGATAILPLPFRPPTIVDGVVTVLTPLPNWSKLWNPLFAAAGLSPITIPVATVRSLVSGRSSSPRPPALAPAVTAPRRRLFTDAVNLLDPWRSTRAIVAVPPVSGVGVTVR